MSGPVPGTKTHSNGNPAAVPLRVAQISDLHLTRTEGDSVMGVDPRVQLARVLAAVNRFAPHCLLVTGDVAHDGDAESYRALRRALAPALYPVYAIPGNHDDPAALARELGPCPLVAGADPWRIVLLDTHVAGCEGGAVDPVQLAAAQRRLDAVRGPVLVALHHPPRRVGSPWLDGMGLENAPMLRAWLDARNDVRLVIAGHVHQAVRRRFGPAPLLTAPATSAQFTPHTATFRIEDRRPAWRALWLYPDGKTATRIHRLRRTSARPSDAGA